MGLLIQDTKQYQALHPKFYSADEYSLVVHDTALTVTLAAMIQYSLSLSTLSVT